MGSVQSRSSPNGVGLDSIEFRTPRRVHALTPISNLTRHDSRGIIVPPPPVHTPPRNRLEIMQAQNLLERGLDVFLGSVRVARRIAPLLGDGDGIGRRGRCGSRSGRSGEGVRDQRTEVFRRIEVVGYRVWGVDRLGRGSAMDGKGTVYDGWCAMRGAVLGLRCTTRGVRYAECGMRFQVETRITRIEEQTTVNEARGSRGWSPLTSYSSVASIPAYLLQSHQKRPQPVCEWWSRTE